MLPICFKLEAALDAVSLLVEHHDGRIGRDRLLALLYIADRELLFQRGYTLTGDRPFATRRGLILERMSDLVDGEGIAEHTDRWAEVIRCDGSQVMLAGVARKELTVAGFLKIEQVATRYQDLSDDDLSTLTRTFGEWPATAVCDDPPVLVTWEEALRAQGATEGDVAEIREQLQESAQIAKAWTELQQQTMPEHNNGSGNR